jgi:hypothetical protein
MDYIKEKDKFMIEINERKFNEVKKKINKKMNEIISSKTKLNEIDYVFFKDHIVWNFVNHIELFYWLVLRGNKLKLAELILEYKMFDINKKENYLYLIGNALSQAPCLIDEYVYYGLKLNQELLDNVFEDNYEQGSVFPQNNYVYVYLKEQVIINMRMEKLLKIKENIIQKNRFNNQC